MHHYQFYIKDYMADTARLSEMEDLAYRRMLDWCYLNECALPAEVSEVARAIGMRSHCDSVEYVLDTYWRITPDGYVQTRVQDDLAKIYAKSEAARKSAEARWRKREEGR